MSSGATVFSESNLTLVRKPAPTKPDLSSRLAQHGEDGILGLTKSVAGASTNNVLGGLVTKATDYSPNNQYANPGSIAAVNNRGGKEFLSYNTRVDVAAFALDSPAAADIKKNATDNRIDESLKLEDLRAEAAKRADRRAPSEAEIIDAIDAKKAERTSNKPKADEDVKTSDKAEKPAADPKEFPPPPLQFSNATESYAATDTIASQPADNGSGSSLDLSA